MVDPSGVKKDHQAAIPCPCDHDLIARPSPMHDRLRLRRIVEMILGAAPGLSPPHVAPGAEGLEPDRVGVVIIFQPVEGRRERLLLRRRAEKRPEPADTLELMLV